MSRLSSNRVKIAWEIVGGEHDALKQQHHWHPLPRDLLDVVSMFCAKEVGPSYARDRLVIYCYCTPEPSQTFNLAFSAALPSFLKQNTLTAQDI